MSASPVPPVGDGNGENDGTDWRAGVQQRYRNTEIKEISKVLAALEPGTTAVSKLRLAMQFEDTVFKAASSLPDYRKRLTKRLKKLQKSYSSASSTDAADSNGLPATSPGTQGTSQPHDPVASSPASNPASSNPTGITGTSNTVSMTSIVEQVHELRLKFGPNIRYILENADLALAEMMAKHGEAKAAHLRQYTDSVKTWAEDLGIEVHQVSAPTNPGLSSASASPGQSLEVDKKGPAKARTSLLPLTVENCRVRSGEQLDKLASHLEKRVDNIRSHIVKLADPDLFLRETLARMEEFEDAAKLNSGSGSAEASLSAGPSPDSLTEAAAARSKKITLAGHQLLAIDTTKRYKQLLSQKQQHDGSSKSQRAVADTRASDFDPVVLLQKSLDRAQFRVPLPTRNEDAIQLSERAARIHLDKMRAAATIVLAYVCIADKKKHRLGEQKVLQKAHDIVTEGVAYAVPVLHQYRARLLNQTNLTLEDAWQKPLEYVPPSKAADSGDGSILDVDLRGDSMVEEGSTSTSTTRPSKRMKLEIGYARCPYIKSRVLLTPNRKVPRSFETALGRQKVQLIRPGAQGEGTHLVMDIGTAFSIIVYFSPLTVEIRAYDCLDKSMRRQSGDDSGYEAAFETMSCASWRPLHTGLLQRTDLCVWGTRPSSYGLLGHVVEERLRDASAHATRILRQCFIHNVKDKTLEFEVEILEATAVLEFIRIARTTYQPNWQDGEGA
jgi:KIX domain